MISGFQTTGSIIAQSSPAPVNEWLVFWLAVAGMVVLITVGGAVVFWARRSARGPVPVSRPGFSLEDLRDMLDRKEITQREYDTARDVMLHKARQAAQNEREQRGGTDWSGPESQRPSKKPGR